MFVSLQFYIQVVEVLHYVSQKPNSFPLSFEARATQLCSHTFSVELILEPREGWIMTSMLTPHQTNRPKRALTSMCMEVTYNCRLLGLSLLLVFAEFAHMLQ